MNTIFNSGFMAKLLFFAMAGACILILQLKVERLQAQNKEKETQISNLQQTLANQENALQTLVREHEKQEQELLAFAKQKQNLEKEISMKKQAVMKSSDEKSRAWKNEEIPLPVLAILQGKNKPIANDKRNK